MNPGAPPSGDPAPPDGSLPAAAVAEAADQPLSFYVHVPYCRTRCGYCDFNTYTATELGSGPGASRDTWAQAAIAELDLARRVLPETAGVGTVFFGGGTPTLLPPDDLGSVLDAIDDRFGLLPGAEVTTESNPDSVDAADLTRLRDLGFNRISFGMQSASAHVLQLLERTHRAGRPQEAVQEARAAGFDSVSLDLIYGTPGESATDWQQSLDAALAAEPDHVSAYALIVEEGTRLGARVRRGEVPMTDDDDHADKYLQTEQILTTAGFSAYEVSNWARAAGPNEPRVDHRCAHNLAYWRGGNWWGVGPGAHSHVGGVRWWNVRHPAAWAARLAAQESPAQAREMLGPDTRRVERVLLELRLSEGLDLAVLTRLEQERITDLVRRELAMINNGRLVLTLSGRLLADGIVRDLLD
ncbi:MAG: radical SAM family heme chaperone HemW [Propionibacteriales bacterium]|nr:radical SAM family heme chaperone HemW [Propionibacteriales bacterium]